MDIIFNPFMETPTYILSWQFPHFINHIKNANARFHRFSNVRLAQQSSNNKNAYIISFARHNWSNNVTIVNGYYYEALRNVNAIFTTDSYYKIRNLFESIRFLLLRWYNMQTQIRSTKRPKFTSNIDL